MTKASLKVAGLAAALTGSVGVGISLMSTGFVSLIVTVSLAILPVALVDFRNSLDSSDRSIGDGRRWTALALVILAVLTVVGTTMGIVPGWNIAIGIASSAIYACGVLILDGQRKSRETSELKTNG